MDLLLEFLTAVLVSDNLTALEIFFPLSDAVMQDISQNYCMYIVLERKYLWISEGKYLLELAC